MSVVVRFPDGSIRLLCKGAVSTFVSRCVATKGLFQAVGGVWLTGKQPTDERGSMANKIVTVPWGAFDHASHAPQGTVTITVETTSLHYNCTHPFFGRAPILLPVLVGVCGCIVVCTCV